VESRISSTVPSRNVAGEFLLVAAMLVPTAPPTTAPMTVPPVS
jgi:hypothetical protein